MAEVLDIKEVLDSCQGPEKAEELVRKLLELNDASLLEDLARWVRHQPGMESLKQLLVERCFVPHRPGKEKRLLCSRAARELFETLAEAQVGIRSLVYPYLMMRVGGGEGFAPVSVLMGLAHTLGEPSGEIEGEVELALQELEEKGFLEKNSEGYLFLRGGHMVDEGRRGHHIASLVEGELRDGFFSVAKPGGFSFPLRKERHQGRTPRELFQKMLGDKD